ncbi:hypothetical protein ISN45_Aa07g005400 [Arabidopsis thaliana x Arabidopsis arenosa]|uniref:Uncharacterized protein n=1 Tax=Arabidopsis thaliana x Arabidopsis arenosa TaxID=1240361 RepID=A0A8T1XZ10_9BRAS|nr:hypothetical protein ISN45_Aa07g005400 [Arabidopsis thaliana x Arabidopsis arenosa]
MYLEMMYELLPYHYQSQEINRLTLAHFIISGLHFLGAIDRVRLSLISISVFSPEFSFSNVQFLKVDKDVVAKCVLSFQALPSNRVSLKEDTFLEFS